MKARVLTTMLAMLLAGAAPAHAVPNTCGGSWSGVGVSDGCVLVFKGFPIAVTASAHADDAATAVAGWIELEVSRVTIPPVPSSYRVALVACAAARFSGAACSQSAGSSQIPVKNLPLGAVLRCRVAGYDHGTFGCSSGV